MDTFAMIARIEALLKEKKIPKMVFYKQVPISASAFSLWRSGDTFPTNENISKMAEIVGTTEQYLLFGNSSEIKKEPVTESDELEKYIDMLRTRPEMRLLLDTQDGATKEQVEENVRFLDALRKAKNAD